MKIYNIERNRAEFLIKNFDHYLKGNILDVGSGGSPILLKKLFKDSYTSLDIAETRCVPEIFCDFEKEKLPIPDNSFNTVLCMDCLEHVENIHSLFDELIRVSNKYIIVSLPNNWPGLIKSFFKGKQYTHVAGYGLKADPDHPGFRHKWFFNLEEAENFLFKRSKTNNSKILESKYVYEYGQDSLFNFFNYSNFMKVQPYHLKKIIDEEAVHNMNEHNYKVKLIKKLGFKKSCMLLNIIKFIYAKPLDMVDNFFRVLIWGWGGKYRYLNLFCRQLWVVIQKK